MPAGMSTSISLPLSPSIHQHGKSKADNSVSVSPFYTSIAELNDVDVFIGPYLSVCYHDCLTVDVFACSTALL